MSYGVACERQICRHFEEAHDPQTGQCLAEWGPPDKREHCKCPAIILPADANDQREFARRMREFDA